MHFSIVLNAQLPPVDVELISTIVFPEVGDTQVTIPANAIIHQRMTEGAQYCLMETCIYTCHDEINVQ